MSHFLDVADVQSWLAYFRRITGNEGKLKRREFNMILANPVMRLKSISTKRERPSLSDVERELPAKARE